MRESWARKVRQIMVLYRGRLLSVGAGIAAVIPAAIGVHQAYDIFVKPLLGVDLSGRWCVTDVVTTSQHQDYVGMSLKFELMLRQDKGEVVGHGRKVLVQGIAPPPTEASWLDVKDGQIAGDTVALTFVEGNDARPDRQHIGGTFVWRIHDSRTLVGTFDTSAAGSSGRSEAERLSGSRSCSD